MKQHGILPHTRSVVRHGFSSSLGLYEDAIVALSAGRKLTPSADKCMRIRRASDNDETDIAFIGGNIDEQAINDFGGYNLLSYTEDLSNSVWIVGKTGNFSIEVSSGITAPDGTNTAFNVRMSLEGATGGNDILDFKQDIVQNLILGEDYSASIFLRSGDGVSKTLGFFNVVGGSNSITVGTEWQKYEFTNTSNSNGLGVLRFRLQGSSTDNLVNLEVWRPQVEIGSSASEYQPRIAGGASDCFVATLYDQSENDNHATQIVADAQPKIYDVTSGEVTKENGKPAMVFNGVNDFLKLIDDGIIATQPNSIATVAARKGGTNSSNYLFDGANGKQIIMINQNDYALFSGHSITSSNSSDTNQHLFLGEFGLTTDTLFIDSIEVASGNAGSNNLGGMTIGSSLNNNNNTLSGVIQEMIIFDTNLTTQERQALHNDINTYYRIY